MKRINIFLFFIQLFFVCSFAQEENSIFTPVEYIYKIVDTTELSAFVFFPEDNEKELRSAVLVFHGGGWSAGTPEWAFSRGRHFVQQGMLAVAVEYRLSDQVSVTPIDAMNDARDAVHWLRTKGNEFMVDTSKVAAYGWSAGGHLAASTAIFNNDTANISSVPNALLLVSPALELTNDSWISQLLLDETEPVDISPAQHVKPNLPPTIIVHGRGDTVTPLDGIELFTKRMKEAGNVCELFVYDGVGHMFTPSTESDKGWPNPDQEIKNEAYFEIDSFLRELGFENDEY